MKRKPTIAALAALSVLALASGVQARPYLMLYADDKGFQALDLGDMRQKGDVAEVTVIQAPLAGAPYADKVAPLIKQKVEVACEVKRWRVVSSDYVDAHETLMARDPNEQAWTNYDHDDLKSLVQSAACLKLYSQNLVSRYLSLGEILAGYQAAHGKAQPERLSEKQLLAERARNNH